MDGGCVFQNSHTRVCIQLFRVSCVEPYVSVGVLRSLRLCAEASHHFCFFFFVFFVCSALLLLPYEVVFSTACLKLSSSLLCCSHGTKAVAQQVVYECLEHVACATSTTAAVMFKAMGNVDGYKNSYLLGKCQRGLFPRIFRQTGVWANLTSGRPSHGP